MAPDKLSSLRTKIVSTVQSPRTDEGIKTLRYEEALAAKPPIPVTTAPPRSPPNDTHPALRRSASGFEVRDPRKRDSGLAPTESTAAREGSSIIGEESSSSALTGVSLVDTSGPVRHEVLNTPESLNTVKSDSASTTTKWKRGSGKIETAQCSSRSMQSKLEGSETDFSPITTPIPNKSELQLDFMDHIAFSKRGSVLLGGKKALSRQPRANIIARQSSFSMTADTKSEDLSDELEKESLKVRSMYEIGNPINWANGRLSDTDSQSGVIRTSTPDESELLCEQREESIVGDYVQHDNLTTLRNPDTGKLGHELAGGIEDWEDVDGGDVDRYGFIMVRKLTAEPGGISEMRPPQRVSTVLQLASQVPRKRRGLVRSLSSSKSSRSLPRRITSRKISSRSLNTTNTGTSKQSSRSRSQPFRTAANRLPGNRDRRWMDEAGDMLTLPPGLADIAEEEEGGKAAENAKRKEWSRTEKWRRMAKITKSTVEGSGMQFEFDIRHPKLIERTWKGIPDRWRAAAWHSFLSTSAKRRNGSASDSEIVEEFHRLLQRSSADDVQIDMDVPRTINSHIMFRRRYRGGQRLLFRVLHALSLYFPGTGYVQGMASLAATLLCYYDEERTFIMLVRMWQERGMDKLYEPGFPGLMAALDEFQKEWMNGHDVSKKLDEFGIEPTAYGTRWYLTLFNYSIPFPAQLRVWDVFMLLGDPEVSVPVTATERPFAGGLDVLHAASAALIDGTRDILLDSDFENTMKVLTSWIPVKDEDLFMRVAKAEWKLHHSKRRP